MLKYRAISFPLLIGLLILVFFAPMEIGIWVFSLCATVTIGLATYECARMVNHGLAPCFVRTAGVLSALITALFMLAEIMFLLDEIKFTTEIDIKTRINMLDSIDLSTAIHVFATCLIMMMAWLPWIFTVFGDAEDAKKIFVTVGVVLATVLPFGLVARLYFPKPEYLFFVMMVTKAMDTGGYVFGMLSNKLLPGGNHKLCPSISPKKSWEGFAGGVFLAVLTAWALRAIFPDTKWDFSRWLGEFAWWKEIVFAVLLALASIAGDLTESALKRKCGVKDSGNLIPGMGGPLDVLDSFIYVAPVCLIYCNMMKY